MSIVISACNNQYGIMLADRRAMLKYPDGTLVLCNDNYGKIGRLNSNTCIGFVGREKVLSKFIYLLPICEEHNIDNYNKLICDHKHIFDMTDKESCAHILGYNSQRQISFSYYAAINNYGELPEVPLSKDTWKIKIECPLKGNNFGWLFNEVCKSTYLDYDKINNKLQEIVGEVAKFCNEINDKIDTIEFKDGVMYEKYFR